MDQRSFWYLLSSARAASISNGENPHIGIQHRGLHSQDGRNGGFAVMLISDLRLYWSGKISFYTGGCFGVCFVSEVGGWV
ncbi:uncharacterized protein N7529_000443 [Penicillium soppii]|uniref:uncharacterized protein n=1 Tax=Penicillium soppii TaxID=69789 RepID=UPI002546ED3E|nr:uncharacterized protein N7529_000443 [Penicillium soppii]KAJ5881771.1 hypothetical protein N7529_000443 [Penicillium soppii]